jgi:hypothetical protein
MKVYDPDQVLFLFATVPIKGYADGTFINIEAQERFVTKVGADGVVTRTKTNSKVDRITISLMPGSDSNDVLSAVHILDLDSANGAGVAPLAIKDLSGRFLYMSPEAWIVQPPNVEFAKEPGQRDWIFEAVDATRFDGGS